MRGVLRYMIIHNHYIITHKHALFAQHAAQQTSTTCVISFLLYFIEYVLFKVYALFNVYILFILSLHTPSSQQSPPPLPDNVRVTLDAAGGEVCRDVHDHGCLTDVSHAHL